MTAYALRPTGIQGRYFVEYDGRVIGEVVQNVVGIGALKWTARRAPGETLDGIFTYNDEAAEALVADYKRRTR